MLTLVLFCVAAAALLYYRSLTGSRAPRGTKKRAPGPRPWPLIGNLHLLHHKEGPFVAFDALAERYGDVYSIRLGSTDCVVVSSYDLLKEVLITKGAHFGGRPDFIRFHELFGGDRNNSLALCDWSDLQRQRRSLARSFCSPRGGSRNLEELSSVAAIETEHFMNLLNDPENAGILSGKSAFKPYLQICVANMFTRYMCSSSFGFENQEFNHVVRLFDEIFWDINQGYALDFLPYLKPFYTKHLRVIRNWGAEIRSFILRKIIDERRENLEQNRPPKDFTDALLLHLENEKSDLNWEHIMYELEDFLGGHSAIGNLVMLVLANIVIHPEVQENIHQEVEKVLQAIGSTNGIVGLENRNDIPYTEAVLWETLRVASSPIVPHMATKDTDIGGYVVKKDTMIFLNNLQLNLGEKYWGPDHREFNPNRFLKTVVSDSGVSHVHVNKPEHFMPFSTGKRTCIGQKLVQGCSIVLIAAIVNKFHITSVDSEDLRKHMVTGCVAVPPDAFHLSLQPRK